MLCAFAQHGEVCTVHASIFWVLAIRTIFWALVSDTGAEMWRSRWELDSEATRHLYNSGQNAAWLD